MTLDSAHAENEWLLHPDRPNWIRAGATDWRVWALVACGQIPALHPIAKYSAWPVATAFSLAIAAFITCALLLHSPRIAAAACRLSGRSWQMALAVALLALLNGYAYPRMDARKAIGRGSDQDDALIETGRRLLFGRRPVYVETYLHNAPSVGPGWALLVAPIAISGLYFCLIPIAVGVLSETAARNGGGPAGRSLALILPMTSLAFWQQMVNGADVFAAAVTFVLLTAAIARWRWRDPISTAAVVVLTLIAETCRAAGIWPCAVLAFFLWRRRHPGWTAYAALVAGVGALEIALWLPDAAGVTPLASIFKGVRMLGAGQLAIGGSLAAAAAIIAARLLTDRISSWWLALWIAIGIPLAGAGVASLAAIHWDLADWYESSYFTYATVLLIAYVAARRAPRPADASLVPLTASAAGSQAAVRRDGIADTRW